VGSGLTDEEKQRNLRSALAAQERARDCLRDILANGTPQQRLAAAQLVYSDPARPMPEP